MKPASQARTIAVIERSTAPLILKEDHHDIAYRSAARRLHDVHGFSVCPRSRPPGRAFRYHRHALWRSLLDRRSHQRPDQRSTAVRRASARVSRGLERWDFDIGGTL